MNSMQLMQVLRQALSSGNPQAMTYSMLQGDPLGQQILQMTQGMNPNQVQNLVQQTCSQRGIDFNQLMLMVNSLGIR